VLEIEQKFARVDFADVERRLADRGLSLDEGHAEADHYFNAPDRDFARTNEAFRLRRVGETNLLTYKGPRQVSSVKVRTEIEVPFAAGDEAAEQMERLLVHLGYRPVAVVRKHRRGCRLERGGFALTVFLDEVEQLGRFAEVEILAEEEKKEEAGRVLSEVAAELGLHEVQPRSYLGLLLQKLGESRPGE
jgi:adenylate cyclase class 2